MRLTALPRVRLGTLPTPLQKLENLSDQLGGPGIWMKRDDLTGLAMGGNKTRMLEYLIGDALSQGASHIITEGGPQSNHVRQTLAAARIHNLETVIVQNPTDPEPTLQGNFLLDRLLGIDYRQVATEHERGAKMEEIADGLTADGARPYIIPGGGSNDVGSVGYVSAMLEIQHQVWDLGVNPTALYFASGGGGTQAGIALGAALFHCDFPAIGIAIEDDGATVADRAWKIIEATAKRLGVPLPLERADLICRDGHVGPGYAIPTEECIDAIRLLARTEGIFLEPIYTAKAFAGMLAAIERGDHQPDEDVIFLHTGGAPVLFALVDQLEQAIG
ncbi:D-cysteine desulfhydrase [soil metagenome]